MKRNLTYSLSAVVAWLATSLSLIAAPTKPLRALLVAGGCCHDYAGQHKVLSEGIQARANVRVDVVWTDDKSVNPPLPLYVKPNWAEGYDVIIHDECAAGNRDRQVLQRVLAAHQKIPAVHLHCAMHSFRTGTDDWFKHLGIQSTSHGPQVPIDVKFVDTKHPITSGLKDWTTGREELYNNVKVFDAHPLATGTQLIQRNGEEKYVSYVIAWTNEKQGARSFSTTLGHNTATVADDRYLDLVTRGLLWACDSLEDEFLKPYAGENEIKFVKGKPKPKPKPQAKAVLGPAPKGATLVKMTASSVQGGRFPWMAVDAAKSTRWCASNGDKPQWLQIEFPAQQEITEVSIVWENSNNIYGYRLEGSLEGKKWELLKDAVDNDKRGNTTDAFPAKKLRFLRVTGVKTSGGWISLWELTVKGKGIKSLYPKLEGKDKQAAEALNRTANDPFAKGGNIKPKIVKLTAEEEAAILKDTKVPEGFDVSLFAPWQTANYPVYVAAAPNGDLFVSSDGNGSLGRDPGRGRVLRLRDKDGDGRADEVTEFVKDVDSPRGLIWDHDRLYLLHPPHISVFHDRDGDGVAEDSQVLIKGIAFGFEGRPADHTTNGLELGIDGWIYIAGGDFGFLNAEGTDGRRLQHRGGGVIRFRPDGSGLELFATGTRNILGTPTSPLLDLFARDNTNDGGGWDVRFHHFTGLEDHGYPRMYKNFGDEHIPPLADYGGGSGCGSVYIHEPGFPKEWANAPFTCDWGRAASFRHSVERQGATFKEIAEPQPFIRMTRPTDADVDALSRVYQASWKGPATFRWEGPEVGYIVRVKPSGFAPEPLPEFDKLSDVELIKQLESPSHIRALTAQRALLRRDPNDRTTAALVRLAADESRELRARVAALYAIAQRGVKAAQSAAAVRALSPLAGSATLQPFVLRVLGDMGVDRITAGRAGTAPVEILVRGLHVADPRTRVEAMVAAARQGAMGAAAAIAAHLGDSDPVVAHTAFRALARLGASKACFDVLDAAASTDAQREGASFALMRMHRADVVAGLVERLERKGQPASRAAVLSALCRLHHREAEWKGDSWGTRPDTRGPYYQLATWSESETILAALKSELRTAKPADAAALVKEMNRNRIQSNDALERIIDLAIEDESHSATAVAQLAGLEDIPSRAQPLLLRAARNPNASPLVLAQAVESLVKVEHAESLPATLTALAALDKAKGSNKEQGAAQRAFLQNPRLENQRETLVKLAAVEGESGESRWAHAALLELASRKNVSLEAKADAQNAIDVAWQHPARKVTLIRLASSMKNHFLDDRIRAAMTDFDPEVAKAAKSAAKRLKIQPPGADKTPKISTLTEAAAIEAVVEAKGDAALGEAIFARAACVACHTTSQEQPQKGPFLGNIAKIYRRPDLALAILNPNKTIAQGFATQNVSLKSGETLTGFITNEAGDQITLRDIAAQERVVAKSDIAKRETLTISMMPAGLMAPFSVHELASLLDYLQGLSAAE